MRKRERDSDKEKGAEVFLYSIMQSDFSQSFFLDEWEEKKQRERRVRVDKKDQNNNSKGRSAGGTERDRDWLRQGGMSHSKCVNLSE